MLLPLQSAWAAVQLYHSHGSGDSLVDVVFHDHLDTSHSHTHTHGEHAHEQSSNPDQNDRDQTNTTDHHHHFHVHTISVLSEVNLPDFPRPLLYNSAVFQLGRKPFFPSESNGRTGVNQPSTLLLTFD